MFDIFPSSHIFFHALIGAKLSVVIYPDPGNFYVYFCDVVNNQITSLVHVLH